MQAIINQLRATIKERQLWADDAKTARKELEEARLKIAGLEDRLEHGGSTRRRNATEKDGTAFKESERAEVIEGTSEGNKKFDQVDEGLTGQRTNSEPSAQVIQGRSINDLVKIHHVAWGSESIHDESLHLQLMEYAAKGADFTPTGNFVGRDTGPDERKTLVVAYSSPLEAPLRWLILDEGHRGKFSL
ncbi:hypothetical protein GGR54DRAFT_617750 [Hypoxylon sp. NC1633]|nr:hypothetical protein GGR54DRAFT_617750 [Hypoxylon sp. NC1633]